MTTPVLRAENVTVHYEPKLGDPVAAVRNASLTINPGEFVGLVGESGSGKTTFAQAILKMLRRPGRLVGGQVYWGDTEVTNLGPEEIRPLRWTYVSTVFQSSMNALNPVVRIKKVFQDVITTHTDLDEDKAVERATELFDFVMIDPKFLEMFPHELSGGMKQRVNLALALALDPQLVLFDEPTTGLDVVVQKSILDQIRDLQARQHFGAILISHDMGTILDFSDRVTVMFEGEIVEDSATATVLAQGPAHPYATHLLGSYAELLGETVPGYTPVGLVAGEERVEVAVVKDPEHAPVIIEVDHAFRRFEKRQGFRTSYVDAVKDVSFALHQGEVTALVGQSGSGKSTIAKLITRIDRPTGGHILYRPMGQSESVDVHKMSRKDLLAYQKDVQYVFQDPYAALNPALTIAYSLTRPLENYLGLKGQEALDKAAELLESVGLTPAGQYLARFAFELSGGQRQRVVIARALAPNPRLLIADEPIASLDVSIRAEILELLQTLVLTRGVGMLYITHDLLSAQMLADHAIVLNHGEIIEQGSAKDVIEHPKAGYTRELLDAIPNPFRDQRVA